MTICDYNIVMTEANIATLKAKLSHYLHRVRRGEEVLVLDRHTPIAKVVPSQSQENLKVIEAKEPPSMLKKLKYASLKNKKIDSTRLLREDRNRR